MCCSFSAELSSQTSISHNRVLADLLILTLSTLGKIFSRRHFEIFSLFFSKNRIRHFKSCSLGKIRKMFSGKNKKNIINLPSAENAHRVVKVNIVVISICL